MRSKFLAGCLFLFPFFVDHAKSATYDVAVGSAATDVVPQNNSRRRMVIYNMDYSTQSGGGGSGLWCRYGTAATLPAGVRQLGSWLIPAGSMLEYATFIQSDDAVNCVSENGSILVHAEQY